MKRFVFVAFLWLALINVALAATVDTIVTKSASMNKEIKAVVILPNNYGKTKHYPVVYLLHGYSGNYA
ncbi:MAG: esterase family protein, partial [Bacteroidota bacterium]|nr:esterase family protein [Bacteroidota bacterium]